MTAAPAPARPSFKTLFGLACLTAFLASLAGPVLFVLGAALAQGGGSWNAWSGELLPFALIAFLFTFPIGLAMLLLVGPLAARYSGAFIRDHRKAAMLVGLSAGALLGLATAALLFGGDALLAGAGAVSGACYGAVWMRLCAWQLQDEGHG